MRPKVRVILFTKPGCGLCEEMKHQISLANCEEIYTLTEVNIEDEPGLYAQYRFEIPVLAINGIEAFRHRLSADDFRAYVTSVANVHT